MTAPSRRRGTGHPAPEGSGRKSGRLRRTAAQTEECQARAYMLKVSGGLTFDKIASSPDPTGTGPTLYANAAAARQAYLAHADRVRGTEDENPLSVRERRALQDDRYERIIQTWLPKSIGGSEQATILVLRALAGQQDLHGLKMRAAAPDAEAEVEDVADELATRREQSRREAREAALRATAARESATPPRG